MKNTKLLGCLLTLFVTSSPLTVQGGEADGTYHRIIRLTDPRDNQAVEDFFQGKNNFVLECAEGTSFPFRIKVKGQLVELDETDKPLYLNILKTCYLRYEDGENFLFSADLQTWKEFLEFFTGELNISVGIENGNLIADLQLEVNQRESSSGSS